MKTGKKHLEQIIREEIQAVLLEAPQGGSGQFRAIRDTMVYKIKDPEARMVLKELLSVLAGERNLKQ